MRTARLLTVSQYALGRGGVCLGVVVCPGGVSSRAMSAQGGVCPGGVFPGAGVCPGRRSVCPEGVKTPLWTEWQTGVKTLPCRNFVAGGN